MSLPAIRCRPDRKENNSLAQRNRMKRADSRLASAHRRCHGRYFDSKGGRRDPQANDWFADGVFARVKREKREIHSTAMRRHRKANEINTVAITPRLYGKTRPQIQVTDARIAAEKVPPLPVDFQEPGNSKARHPETTRPTGKPRHGTQARLHFRTPDTNLEFRR